MHPCAPECICRGTDWSYNKEAVLRKHLIGRPTGSLRDLPDSGRWHELAYARLPFACCPKFTLDIAVDAQRAEGRVRIVGQEIYRIHRSGFLGNRRDPHNLRIARFRPNNNLVQIPIKIEKRIHRWSTLRLMRSCEAAVPLGLACRFGLPALRAAALCHVKSEGKAAGRARRQRFVR